MNEFMKALKFETEQSYFEINSFDIIKLTRISKYTNDIVQKALDNEVIPFPNFSSFTLKKLDDWNFIDNKYGDSYQLYIHSLRFVNELLLLYDQNKDEKYLDKAREYLDSWIEFVSNNEVSNMVWYDHPTAQRIQVIIYYLYLARGIHKIDYRLFRNLLIFHSKFLADNSNYRRNNHGLMMDRSLMILGNILDDESVFNIGYYRSVDTFWYCYSYQALHLENSPEYHNMVTKMYIELQKYLANHNKTYGTTIVSYLNRANQLKNVFTKPNGILPSIGDSGHGKVKITKDYSNFIDYAAGLTLIQDERNELFLSFISGYSTTVHKHIDDLSFNFFYKGVDFFVDPGKYSYSKHPYRGYVKSFKGHSGIFINEKNYKISEDNRMKKFVKIKHHFENDNYFLVKGQNNSYDEAELYRTIIYIKKEQAVVIIDDISSKKEISALHNFNLHHAVVPRKISNYEYELIHDDISVVFRNHNKDTTFQEVLGDKKNEPYKAINSVVFNEVVETKQLKNTERLNEGASSRNIYSIVNKGEKVEINFYESEMVLKVCINSNEYHINV